MTKGKATKEPLEYQVLGRDILLKKYYDQNLVPCTGEGVEIPGVDVPFEVAGNPVTFDIALKSTISNKIVIAECRRVNRSIKQEEIYALRGKAREFADAYGFEVIAHFIAIKSYQIGPLKIGPNLKISLNILDPNDTAENFSLFSKWFDVKKEKEISQMLKGLSFTATVTVVPSCEIVVIKADGTKIPIDPQKGLPPE